MCEELQKMVVVVVWTGNCVQKNRTEDGGSGRMGECMKIGQRY
jgi:hypothetical protein